MHASCCCGVQVSCEVRVCLSCAPRDVTSVAAASPSNPKGQSPLACQDTLSPCFHPLPGWMLHISHTLLALELHGKRSLRKRERERQKLRTQNQVRTNRNQTPDVCRATRQAATNQCKIAGDLEAAKAGLTMQSCRFATAIRGCEPLFCL